MENASDKPLVFIYKKLSKKHNKTNRLIKIDKIFIFIKEDIWMTSKHMKRCLTSLTAIINLILLCEINS